MKTKEKTHRAEKSLVQETKSIYRGMEESDMTPIDLKIYEILIAEGYRAAITQRFDGIKLNNYTNVNRMEYIRGEHERVIVTTKALD